MSQSSYIEVSIPALPPGANKTYQPVRRAGKTGLILTKEARAWDAEAALIVGSAAGQYDFKPDSGDYQIIIRWWGGRHDTDAHLKLVQDTVTRKLGFDDRQISACVIQRIAEWGEDEPAQGVKVHLFKAIKRDWVTDLLFECLNIERPIGVVL